MGDVKNFILYDSKYNKLILTNTYLHFKTICFPSSLARYEPHTQAICLPFGIRQELLDPSLVG